MSWPEEENILEVRIGYVANGQQCYNVLHFQIDENGPDADSPLELSEDVVVHLTAEADTDGSLLKSMRSLMGSDVEINTIAAQGIFPTRFRAFTGTVTGLNGLGTTPSDAQNVAAVVEKFGAIGNRRNVGTVHIGGLANNVYADGKMSAGALLLMTAFGDAYAEGMNVTSSDPANPVHYSPAILNRTKIIVDGKPHWPITGHTEVVGTTPKETLRVMRRRTVGHGI